MGIKPWIRHTWVKRAPPKGNTDLPLRLMLTAGAAGPALRGKVSDSSSGEGQWTSTQGDSVLLLCACVCKAGDFELPGTEFECSPSHYGKEWD